MKLKLYLLIFIFSFIGILDAQVIKGGNCWIDYEIIVDSNDAPTVLNLLDSFFSKPENRIEGVTYNLTQFNYKDKDFEATHLFQVVGPADALSKWHHNPPSIEGQLAGVMVNQFIEPYSAFFGKNIISFGTPSNDKLEFTYSLKVNDEEKFSAAWVKAIKALKPDNFVGLGSVIAGGSDGQTHYIYTQRDDMEAIFNPKAIKGSDKIWKTFSEEAGEFEVIRKIVRTRLKIWE